MYQEASVISVTATGGAGTSTGNTTAQESFNGALWGCWVDYGSAPVTTVIKGYLAGGPGGSDVLLFTTAAGNTNKFIIPRIASQKASDGAASTFYEPVPTAGRKLKIVVLTADDTNVVKVYPIIMV